MVFIQLHRKQPSAPSRNPPLQETTTTPDAFDVSTPVINELLCFVSNKIASMPYNMLLKLCTDFYGNEAIACAKDTLYNCTVEQPGRRRVTHRGTDRNQRDVQDILNVFLELSLHAIPLFVCKDLANLPPLTMNNFDMASVIKNIETLRTQVSLLTESHGEIVKSQATLCQHLTTNDTKSICSEVTRAKTRACHEDTDMKRPHIATMNDSTTSARNTNDAIHVHSSIFSDESSDSHSTKSTDSESEGDDHDLIRLATIQNQPSHRKYELKRRSSQIQSQKHRHGKNEIITGSGSFTQIRAAKDRRPPKHQNKETVPVYLSQE